MQIDELLIIIKKYIFDKFSIYFRTNIPDFEYVCLENISCSILEQHWKKKYFIWVSMFDKIDLILQSRLNYIIQTVIEYLSHILI